MIRTLGAPKLIVYCSKSSPGQGMDSNCVARPLYLIVYFNLIVYYRNSTRGQGMDSNCVATSSGHKNN